MQASGQGGPGIDRTSVDAAPLTFLFTDIEGSTERWEREPESMARAVIAHDALLRKLIEEHHGRVVKSTGDGVYAVFARAVDGVRAVVSIQLALGDLSATAGIALKVRCGLHSGQAQRQDDDYIGATIHRAARVMSLAYGGQVLVSEAAAGQLAGVLPAPVQLRDLGEVRLKGLSGTERVFQVVHPALLDGFPPLQSLAAPPNNLPGALSSFVGRDREIAEAQELLARTRLLTMHGGGGFGKTRLALEVASALVDVYRDGAWFVDLSPIRDGSLIAGVAAKVVGVREEPDRPILSTLCAHLKTRSLLLVLDNCEHLLEPCAQLAIAILQAAPDVRILATSREPLHVSGEQTYALPTLPTPKPTDGMETVMQCSAVRLFVERAKQHKPAFVLDEHATSEIAKIVRRLDGIPLALELAAARVRSLSLVEINARLADRYKLLRATSHGRLERQQTLRALVDWSYDLLQRDEQIVFERLSSFSGGCDLAAVEAVCGDDPIDPADIADLIGSLVDKSLVVAEQGGVATRYRMLETIREYARLKLVERGEVERTGSRHCEYYLSLAKAANRSLNGADQAAWLTRLENERDNFRTAMGHALSSAGDPAAGVKMEVALQGFRVLRGHATEGRDNIDSLLAVPAVSEWDLARSHALYTGAALASSQGDDAEAESMLETCLALRRPLANGVDIAATLSTLSSVKLRRGNASGARDSEMEALAIFTEIGDRVGQGIALLHLGEIEAYVGAYEESRRFLDKSLAIARELPYLELESDCERTLGRIALECGNAADARDHFARALDVCTRSENKSGIALALAEIGRLELSVGNKDSALRHARESLGTFDACGMNAELIASLESHACLMSEFGCARDAARLLGAAASAQERRRMVRAPYREREYARIAHAVRGSVDDGTFEAAWAEGVAMGLGEAVALALTLDDPSSQERHAPSASRA